MQPTSIEWCTHSSNPIRARDKQTNKLGHYCTKISSGCRNCYAEGLNFRWGNEIPYKSQHADRIEFEINYKELDAWKKRTKPARVFVEDMSDLFHEKISTALLELVFAHMLQARTFVHFLCLTKRIDRAKTLLLSQEFAHQVHKLLPSSPPSKGDLGGCWQGWFAWPPANIHIGTSIENQQALWHRGKDLAALASAGWTTFYSAEPILGPIDFTNTKDLMNPNYFRDCMHRPLCNGVIAGGESGSHARPVNPDLIRTIRDQCRDHGIPFFFKQWGHWQPNEIKNGARTWQHGPKPQDWPWNPRDPRLVITDDIELYGLGKEMSGNTLDGRQHLNIPNETCIDITQVEWLEATTPKPKKTKAA